MSDEVSYDEKTSRKNVRNISVYEIPTDGKFRAGRPAKFILAYENEKKRVRSRGRVVNYY